MEYRCISPLLLLYERYFDLCSDLGTIYLEVNQKARGESNFLVWGVCRDTLDLN